MSIGNQQTLQKYASPLFVSSTIKDKDVPFSFRDWYNAYRGIIPGQEYGQYNSYLTDWYKNKAQETTDPKIQLRLNYLTLLKQLQVFFTEEEAENWYNKVDITNDKELLLSIPYFARKLKDISLYYLQLRNSIKESRLKYNQVGTNVGVLEQLQKLILLNYTQKPNSSISLPSSVWRNVPELSSIKDTITIQIEELYDTKNYFDRSPTIPISSYTDTDSLELSNFLTSKGLSLTSTEWIYKLGINPLSANYIELSGGDLTELSKQIAEKYLGEDKYISTTQSFSARTDFFDIPLSLGNNFLMWPSGVYNSKTKLNSRYITSPINESGLSTGATAGSSLELADTVFKKTTRGIEGAWYRNNLYDYKTSNMSAKLDANSKTEFRFPFPGYGISAEDITWTGFDLKSTPQFLFLNNEIQQDILRNYWSTTIDLTSCKPLPLNDTTLISNRAYPSKDYNHSDYIKIWSTPPNYDDVVFSGPVDEAWLYKMTQTDISISQSGSTVIVWPYESIDPNDDFPSYYPTDFASVCNSLRISGINFSKAIAGNALSSSDVVYKITNYQDSPELATECCWLSGKTKGYAATKILKTEQRELQFIATPGEYTKFIWEGPEFTDANNVFKSLKHQPDCKFVKTNDSTYLNSDLCTCEQVLFTPFGNPGENYNEYNGFTDFIIENNFDPQDLDLSVWRDSTNTSYLQSSAFGWFKTNSKTGWGDGQWFTGSSRNGNNFYLQNGKAYVYYRAAVKKEDKEVVVLPEYVVRYPYNAVKQTWVRALKNADGEWVSADQSSSMVVRPGDILLYQRAQTSSYSLTSAELQPIDISENRGSIWTSSDYISIGPDKSFVLSYPYEIYTGYVDILPRSNPDVTILSSQIINDRLVHSARVTSISTVNTASNLSAAMLTAIRAVDPTPNTFGIYYESNNTVTFTFQITSLQSISDDTITVLTSTVNTTSNLSAAKLAAIRAVDPTPNTFGIYYESNNTVTFFFQTTSENNAQLKPEQLPALNLNSNIVSILQWSLSVPGQPIQYFKNQPSVLLTPTLTGLYTFAVTAMSAAILPPTAVPSGNTFYYTNTGLYVFTNIPSVTAVPNTVLVESLTSYNTPVPGFVLNTPLKGWDYNLGQVNRYSLLSNSGAKPYWAKAYNQKDEYTGFKGIESWGKPQRFTDKYNILTQPEISDIVLEVGNRIEYTRKTSVDLAWIQPVDLTVTVDNNEWCTLNVIVSNTSNLADQIQDYKNDLEVYPTTETSNLSFESFVDNEPVEVYYNALNSFTWNITANPQIPETIYQAPSAVLGIMAKQPWANLSNQFYPTVAASPELDELHGAADIGGFFTPMSLGASVYVDQDYTATLSNSSTALGQYFENIKQRYSGRGLTKEVQQTPYINYTENNIWLKEPTVTGPIAGTNKKSIFKKYQKFVPYQSGYESNPRLKIGLLNPQSRQSPWGGKEDSEWTDLLNKPTTFTGELDIEVWADTQILKQVGLQVDNWVTDIFGNQYSLYKDLNNVLPINRKNIPGEIWVRKNSQLVEPASKSLLNVFDTYSDTNIVNELTGSGVRKIDLFFDTLLIETSGSIIFEKINYDYNTDNIFSVADEARYISLAIPIATNFNKEFSNISLSSYSFAKAGETWFFPERKEVVQTICGLVNGIVTPELYQIDLNTQILKKIFPISIEDITTINSLSSLGLKSIEPPILSHNNLKKEFLLTILGKSDISTTIIIELKITDLTVKNLASVTIYTPTSINTLNEPPIISQNLFVSLSANSTLNFQCNAENGPTVYEKIAGPAWVNLAPTGLFTGIPPLTPTTYNVTFKVSNTIGPTFYSFIVVTAL